MTVTVDISVKHPDWPEGRVDYSAVINAALLAAGFDEDTELSLVLADDAFVQELNRDYRAKDRPTNILSFPQDEAFCLGDLVLAYETVVREAKEQNKSFSDHLTHLLVHGCLHLLGFDHIDDQEAGEMEALEIQILDKMGITNPYDNVTMDGC